MKDLLIKVLGNRIRRLRRQMAMTITDLAFESDMEYMQLSRIELGLINTSIFQLYKICKALKIDLAELFENIDDDIIKNLKN